MTSVHIETLQWHLGGLNRCTESDVKLALHHLTTEAKQRFVQGSPSSLHFFRATQSVITRMRGVTFADMRMSCLHDASLYFFANGFAGDALSCARSMLNFATRTQDKSWLRKANMTLAIVYADIGSIVDAIPHFYAALKYAQAIRDDVGYVSTLINLGNAFNYTGLYSDAISCYEAALQAMGAIDKSKVSYDLEACALCNLAQCQLFLGRRESAHRAISQAIRHSTEPRNALDALGRAIREWTFTLVMLELGCVDQARQHATLCEHHALLSGTAKSKWLADMANALCLIYEGEPNAAIKLLESTELVSLGLGSLKTDFLRGMAKAYEAAGLPERALDRLNELLAYFRSTREQKLHAHLSELSRMHIGPNEAENQDLTLLQHRAELRAKVAEARLISSQFEILERLAIAADMKDDPTGAHGLRVGRWACLMANELGWEQADCNALELAARLHDIGKVAVPDHILFDSEELKLAEYQLMRNHAIIGGELLSSSQLPNVKMAEEIARFHHERWDGTGYPAKLSGRRIPLHVRIVSLADVFDALTHGRPYADAWPFERAVEEITRGKGTQFDPELADVFVALARRVKREHDDLDALFSSASQATLLFEARSRIRDLVETTPNELQRTMA